MGRPISDKFWGDFNRPGFQLRLEEAWIPGELSSSSNVEILKQSGTRKYTVRNPSSSNEGVVRLVNGVPVNEGEGVKRVYPWTGIGTGATAINFNFKVIFASIVTGGNNYTVGDTLTVNGGTGTSATLQVLAVSSNGTITKVSISNQGNYTVIPTNLNANPVTGGSGTGATFKLVMGVASAAVGSGGAGYVNGNRAMAVVSGNGGIGAVLLGSVTGGAVTSWSLLGAGYGFTGASGLTVDVFGIGAVEYARTILARRVKTWQDNSYVWVKNNAATTFGQALLVTA